MAQRCNELEDAANTSPGLSSQDPSLQGFIHDARAEASRNDVQKTLSTVSIGTSPYSGASFKSSGGSSGPIRAFSVAECPNLAGLELTGSTDPDFAPTAFSELPSNRQQHSLPLWPQMSELWQIYRIHIDPVTKLIHCPSFSEKILLAATHPAAVDANLRALLFSICYAATDIHSPHVVETRFRQRREVLTSLYKRGMEHALGEAVSRQRPSLYILQALVLHIICLYRRFLDSTPEDTTMFDMAVVEARLLCSENSNSYLDSSSLLETELLRRCWWALYVLDYHRAAKVGCAPNTSLHSEHVALPLNLNDIDLSPTINQLPIPRTSITEMSYFLVVIELTQLEAELQHLKNSEMPPVHLKNAGSAVNDRVRAIEVNFIWHCETSRHFDWLLLLTAKAMLNPIEIQMLKLGQTTHSIDEASKNTTSADLSEKTFALSLDVIECWYILSTNANLSTWRWYTDIFHRVCDVKDIKSELAKRPESAQRSRAQTLLGLGLQ